LNGKATIAVPMAILLVHRAAAAAKTCVDVKTP